MACRTLEEAIKYFIFFLNANHEPIILKKRGNQDIFFTTTDWDSMSRVIIQIHCKVLKDF